MPATALTEPCEFNSCRTGSPAEGFNASNHHLNYVNSYPVTAIKYGISTLAPKFFQNGKIDLAVTGFNVGGKPLHPSPCHLHSPPFKCIPFLRAQPTILKNTKPTKASPPSPPAPSALQPTPLTTTSPPSPSAAQQAPKPPGPWPPSRPTRSCTPPSPPP